MTNLRSLTRFFVGAGLITALGVLHACTDSPLGPSDPMVTAPNLQAAIVPDQCRVVDGTWVCSNTTTVATTAEDGPRCVLRQGVWVCEPSES